MATQNKQNENDQVMAFIWLCLQHWKYFVISGAILLALGILYLKIKTPVYAITSKVALRHEDSFGGTVSNVGKQANGMLSMLGIGRSSDNIEDETMVLKSENNIKEVVKTLKLNKNYTQRQFFGLLKDNLYEQSPVILSVPDIMSDTLSIGITFDLNVKPDKTKIKVKADKKTIGKYEITEFPATLETVWGTFTLEKSPYYKDYKKPFKLRIAYANYDVVAQIYQKKLTIKYQKKTSDLIDLTMESENVVMAKKILETTIDSYNHNWDRDKVYGSKQTLAFIEHRLSMAEVELTDIDRRIQEFKGKYNLTDIEADVKYYYTMSGGVQASLLETETQLNLADAIREFIENESNRYSLIPFNLSSSSPNVGVAEIIEKYNEAVLQRNELYQTNAQSALAKSLDYQLDAQRKNIIQSLNKAKDGFETALQTIRRKDHEINKKIGTIPVVERDFLKLKRQQELQQTIYIFLLAKREETAVHYATLMPKIKTIDHPYIINDRVAPNAKIVAALIFLGTIAISLFLIFGIPYLKTFRKKGD